MNTGTREQTSKEYLPMESTRTTYVYICVKGSTNICGEVTEHADMSKAFHSCGTIHKLKNAGKIDGSPTPDPVPNRKRKASQDTSTNEVPIPAVLSIKRCRVCGPKGSQKRKAV